jgi:hypothetical protein
MTEEEDVPSDGEVYEVEEILARKVSGGTDLYLVHWKGYDEPDENTWEPFEHLFSCLELVEEFNSRRRMHHARPPPPPRPQTAPESDASESSEHQPAIRFRSRPVPKRRPKKPERPPRRRPPVTVAAAPRQIVWKPLGSIEMPASIEVCDKWFEEEIQIFPAGQRFVPGPRQKLVQVLGLRREDGKVAYECLFDSGDVRWLDSHVASLLAPSIVQDFLTPGV